VTPDRTSIRADGEDLSIVNITALDAQGREVPTRATCFISSCPATAASSASATAIPAAMSRTNVSPARGSAVFQREMPSESFSQRAKAGTIQFKATSPGL